MPATKRGEMLQDLSEPHGQDAETSLNQRLESVGRLAAGVAHEINTPIQYVSDSVHFLKEGFAAMAPLFEACLELLEHEGDEAPAELVRRLKDAADEADLEYLAERIPSAFDRTLDGVQRVAEIVRALKAFSHPGQKEMAPADLGQILKNMATLARNEYKYVADVEMTLDPALPPVVCQAGDLGQVFLNLVINATHAIEDVVKGTDNRGSIRIATRLIDPGTVEIAVSDTGKGIPADIRDKIFEPFFTTKGIGKGTGQGLPIVRSVVNQHGGTLTLESEEGVGTTFFVRLPVNGKPLTEEA